MDSKAFISYIQNLRYFSYSSACNNMLNNAMVIGKGDYGTAFRLKDGLVVKLFKSHDLAYKTFLKMVVISDNPHLPNILCYDEYSKFGWVVLEFLDEYTLQRYMNLPFETITNSMTSIIRGELIDRVLPLSLHELAEEMRESARGYCLDFRPPNFALKLGTLMIIDPFTLRNKHNTHLVYIEPYIGLKLAS